MDPQSLVPESPVTKSLVAKSPVAESPFTDSQVTDSQVTESPFTGSMAAVSLAAASLQAMDLTTLRAVLAELRPLVLPSRFEQAQQSDGDAHVPCAGAAGGSRGRLWAGVFVGFSLDCWG